MMSNHTDMQDKYCGHCYDIYPIQSQYKGSHKRGGAAECRAPCFLVAAVGRRLCVLALNKVNIVAVPTIPVLHVGVIEHHVRCHLVPRGRSSYFPIEHAKTTLIYLPLGGSNKK